MPPATSKGGRRQTEPTPPTTSDELSRSFMVRMDEDLYRRMRSAAFAAEMTMSAFARHAIEKAVEGKQ